MAFLYGMPMAYLGMAYLYGISTWHAYGISRYGIPMAFLGMAYLCMPCACTRTHYTLYTLHPLRAYACTEKRNQMHTEASITLR